MYRLTKLDVPELWFKRIDGKVFHYDELTACSFNPQVNFTEIQAGQGLYPVAYVPAASTLEVQMTSGEFRADLFELANGEDFAADANYQDFKNYSATVTNNSITMQNTSPAIRDTSLHEMYIAGLTETTNATPANGTFHVNIADNTTTIAFATGDNLDGKTIETNYREVRASATSISVSNDQAAIGEVVMKWPVYNGGETTNSTSFNANSVKGWVYVQIFRARCTAMPSTFVWAA